MKRILTLMFLGSSAFLGGLVAMSLFPGATAPVSAQVRSAGPLPPPGATDRLGERFEWVAQKVSPAVVYIEAVKPATGADATSRKKRSLEESGSGVLMAATDGKGILVLTNNHVITQAKPQQITVNLADGRLFHPQRVYADPESDVAILRLEGAGNVPTAVLGNSDSVRVGQWVLAIGSPFGLNQTVTHGIISARERGQIGLGNTIRIKDFLQTDAAINPGSSGGPLVNLDGQVIGINTAIASPNGNNSGVAFSIPINLVKRVMRQLLDKGSVTRGYLGMQLVQTFEPADALKLGLDRVQGALVEVVYPDTPAATAGLRPNDVVLQVDSTTIRNENHLINLISTLAAGQKIRLQVWRDRKLTTLEAVIGSWSQGRTRFRTGP